VGLNHGRFDIIMTKQFLYRADTGTRFLQIKAATYKTKKPPSISLNSQRPVVFNPRQSSFRAPATPSIHPPWNTSIKTKSNLLYSESRVKGSSPIYVLILS
jgi:hypothetical protein